jgi:hypothetical protein
MKNEYAKSNLFSFDTFPFLEECSDALLYIIACILDDL